MKFFTYVVLVIGLCSLLVGCGDASSSAEPSVVSTSVITQASTTKTISPTQTVVPIQRTTQVSPTPAPSPSKTALDCTNGWTRLSSDHYARVLGGANDPPNRVRAGASKQAEIIAQIYPQDIVKVVEGPVCAAGLVFWRVEHTTIPGGSGWTAEGDLSEYYLEPYVTQIDTVTLSAYGISFTVPGSWSDIPEAEIVPAGDDGMGRTWPQYTVITLSTYPAESVSAPRIYVYKTAELTNTFYGPTAGAPALVRAHQKELAYGKRQVVENGNAHPVFSNRLTYYYQGTSADRLYTFIVVMPINAPFLPESDKNMSLPANGIPFAGMETWDYKKWDTYYTAVQTQLEQASPSLFTPALDILDALVASLTVNTP